MSSNTEEIQKIKYLSGKHYNKIASQAIYQLFYKLIYDEFMKTRNLEKEKND